MVTQLFSQHSRFYYLHKGNVHKSTDIPTTYIHVRVHSPHPESPSPCPINDKISTVGLVGPRATAIAQKYATGHPSIL